jgi:hypothetical protein
LKPNHLPLMLLFALFLCQAGCKSMNLPAYLNPWHQRQQDVPPVLFSTIPPKEELLAALNLPASRVQRIQAQGASVSIAGYPSVPAEFALERPGSFRFRAASSLMGPIVDLGSNPEMLWFWTSQSNPPHVYFARHDRLAGSPIRRMLPIDPAMFSEALGLVELAPENVVGEPITAGKERLQLVCRQMTPAGEVTRTLQIHARHGYLLEQQIADAAGRPLLNARLLDQRHYKLDGVTLPHRMELSLPEGDLRIQLHVPNYSVNQPFTTGETTFAFPREQLGQYQLVDIADPNFVPPGETPPANYASPGNLSPGVGQSPANRYRGRGY